MWRLASYGLPERLFHLNANGRARHKFIRFIRRIIAWRATIVMKDNYMVRDDEKYNYQ